MLIFLSRCLISIPVSSTQGCFLKCLVFPILIKPGLFPLDKLFLLEAQTEFNRSLMGPGLDLR